MFKEILTRTIGSSIEYSFSKSSGPGGQNINKVNTKVIAKLTLNNCSCLSTQDLEKVRTRLKNKINKQDQLVVQVQEHRTQAQNRRQAERKIIKLILFGLRKRKKRLRTKPSLRAIERRLRVKKIRAEIKRQRRYKYC